jgi:hypothetical protein
MAASLTYRTSQDAKAQGMVSTSSKKALGKPHPTEPKQFIEVIS